jgi:hypothetical protein
MLNLHVSVAAASCFIFLLLFRQKIVGPGSRKKTTTTTTTWHQDPLLFFFSLWEREKKIYTYKFHPWRRGPNRNNEQPICIVDSWLGKAHFCYYFFFLLLHRFLCRLNIYTFAGIHGQTHTVCNAWFIAQDSVMQQCCFEIQLKQHKSSPQKN